MRKGVVDSEENLGTLNSPMKSKKKWGYGLDKDNNGNFNIDDNHQSNGNRKQ